MLTSTTSFPSGPAKEPTRAVRYLEQARTVSPIAPQLRGSWRSRAPRAVRGGYANQVRLRYGLEPEDRRPTV
jgi:hypothetical protein